MGKIFHLKYYKDTLLNYYYYYYYYCILLSSQLNTKVVMRASLTRHRYRCGKKKHYLLALCRSRKAF